MEAGRELAVGGRTRRGFAASATAFFRVEDKVFMQIKVGKLHASDDWVFAIQRYIESTADRRLG